MSLSENIKKYRTQKGYTQEQLATQLGVSSQAVSKWETSETYPDGSLLLPLANALEVSLDTLFDNNSASMKEMSKSITRLLSPVSQEDTFHTVRELCWQIEKSLFLRNIPMGKSYVPDELKTQKGSSYLLSDYGFTYASNGKAPFFAVFPEYDNNFSEVIGDGEEMRKIFEALSSEDVMRAALFLHKQPENYIFEGEVLAKECDIDIEHLESVIDSLAELHLIDKDETEIDGENTMLFYSKPSHLLIALFILAHEMTYRGAYCYQAHNRNKPFLTAEPHA